MTSSPLRDGFPSAHRTTRQHIESSIDLHRLFFAIDADPVLIGAGVVFIDAELNVLLLREFQPMCSVQPKKWCYVRHHGMWGHRSSSECWSMSLGNRN